MATKHEVAIQPIRRGALRGGLLSEFDAQLHCVATEPDQTFLRVGVFDGKIEVACEVLVLGRMRCGHRVLQMRHVTTGSRIELCCLFVCISSAKDSNTWSSDREREWKLQEQRERIQELERRLAK